MARNRVYVQMATLSRVCIAIMWNGKPPDKVVAFLMAKKTTHTTQENRAVPSFNFDVNSERMVLLHLKHETYCSWFLPHYSYSDLIYHVIEIPTSYRPYRNFEIQKLFEAILEFGNHFSEHHFQRKMVTVSVSKLIALDQKHHKILWTKE